MNFFTVLIDNIKYRHDKTLIMKLKYLLFIILLVLILFVLTFSFVNTESGFVDNGTSFDNNGNWINNEMNVTRNSDFTTLSSASNSSTWFMANYTIYGDVIIEWDVNGKPENSTYCLISNANKTQDTPLAFNDLNMTPDCHVKLVVKDNKITPYINNITKTPIPLNANPKNGLLFRFQINSNHSVIKYSNFKIHTI